MYDLIQGQYSSDTFVTFNGEEFFEVQESIELENCLAFRFVFSAPDDAVLFCNNDTTDGCTIAFSAGVLDVRCFEGGIQYNLKSNTLNISQYYFVEILININTGDSILYVDGVDQKASNTITGLTDISNTESIKIGGTNRVCSDKGINTIGLFSFTTINDWFTSDVTGFESEYNDYILYKQNPNFPYGGPNSYQLISEEKQSYLQTPPGTANLLDPINLDGLWKEATINFNAKNYIEDNTPVDGFSINRISGADPVYEYASKYSSDESALLTDVSYLSMDTNPSLSYGDMVIESVFKCDGSTGYSYICSYGSFSLPLMYLRTINSTQSIHFYMSDGTTNWNYYSPSDALDTNAWNHIFVVIKRSGELSLYINGSRIETSSEDPFPGSIYNTDGFYLGASHPADYNDSDIFVSAFSVYEQYNWLSTSEFDTFVANRYSDYQTGGIDYHVPIPMTIYTWGDNLGTYPMVMTLDKDNVWQLQYISSTKEGQLLGEFTVNNGIYGVRLFSKFEEDGWSNFDDIQSKFVNIETIQIPKEYKRVLERIVLQTKPLTTWAILMIEWV